MYNRDLWVPPFLRSLHTIKTTTMCVCVGILAAAGCLRWLQYKLLFVCDKWTWRKTPPQSYGYLFKGGLHSNQQIHRKGLPIPRHKKVQKKGPLTFIHSLLAADTQHKRWMNWTGSRCWSSATSYTQAWMMVGSVSCGERDISKSIRSFFFVSSDENYCRVLPDDYLVD